MRSGRPRPFTLPLVAASVVAVLLATIAVWAPPAVGGSTPPPTPVGPSGSPSPFPTVLRTPKPSVLPPALRSSSAILEDLDTGQVLYGHHADERRPVASLTKIMTALVVLEEANLSDTVVVSARAAGQTGSDLGLEVGERISVRQLLFSLLLQSSNDAAVALGEHVAGTSEAFVGMMNARAEEMGMDNTHFLSTNGLDDRGYSTARDLAAITRAAYLEPLFAKIVRTKFHDVPSPSGPARRIQNRNILLWLYPWAIGVKTGFTTPAGHCLVATADQGHGVRLLAVALGAPGPDAGHVFDDGAALLNFGYGAFDVVTFVTAGQPLGSVLIDGRAVPVAGQADLAHLVRRDRVPTIEGRVLPLPGIHLPVAAGQVVARAVAFVGDRTVGELDLVATATVPAPEPSSEPPVNGRPVTSWGGLIRTVAVLIRMLLAAFL